MDTSLLTKLDKETELKFWSPKYITISELMNLKEAEKLNINMSYQRKAGVGSWNKKEYIDRFIDSILRGWFIQTFQWRKSGGSYQVVDSLQRITVISRIYSDLYIPTTLSAPFDHLNEKPFSLWPKEDQEKFLGTRILVTIINEPRDEDLIEYFVRVNKGVPLSHAQAMRGQYAHTLVMLNDVLQHPFWSQEVVSLDSSAREMVIMQLINSLVSDNPDHTSKTLVDWFVSWTPTKEVIDQLIAKLDEMNAIVDAGLLTADSDNYKIIKRFCKKVHLESILYALSGDDESDKILSICSNLLNFFTMKRISRPKEKEEYIAVTYQDTSGKQSIMKRHAIIEKVVNGEIKYPVAESEIGESLREAKLEEVEA